jgi:hypothetical protein
MVMRFSVEQKTRALVNDDLFPAAGLCMSSDTRRANLSPQRPFIAV